MVWIYSPKTEQEKGGKWEQPPINHHLSKEQVSDRFAGTVVRVCVRGVCALFDFKVEFHHLVLSEEQNACTSCIRKLFHHNEPLERCPEP